PDRRDSASSKRLRPVGQAVCSRRPAMRGATTVISLAVMLGGCALLHEPAPLPPVPVAAAPPAGLGCADQARVARWERRLHHDRWFRKTLARGERYLPLLRSILVRQGLPASLALLPAV